eukprot:scaffold7549_cov111-Isochrysis_galbana.AAC.2
MGRRNGRNGLIGRRNGGRNVRLAPGLLGASRGSAGGWVGGMGERHGGAHRPPSPPIDSGGRGRFGPSGGGG